MPEVDARSTHATMSLVVTTVGRPEAFRQLLHSLRAGAFADFGELVLIDQSADQSCADVLRAEGAGLRWQVGTSGPGVSTGRNAGVRLATGDVIGFPDDNAHYTPKTLDDVWEWLTRNPEYDGLSGRQVTESGGSSMLRWARSDRDVSRANFMHTTIASTMFFRRGALERAGEFDEGIGVGSKGWLGAGEESDLLLRILSAGGRVRYRSSVLVVSHDPREDRGPDYARKMLLYGAGTGHLWRRHRLSRFRLCYYVARKLVGVALWTGLHDRWSAKADLAYVRGLVAGWSGRPPPEYRVHAG